MSKRYSEISKLVDQSKQYSAAEAISLAKKTSDVKFDASVEAHFKLNIDPKATDQKIRTQVLLPHGTGKSRKIAVFASPAKEEEARSAGADIIGGEELIKQIKESGKTDFDLAVAEPALMKSLAGIAKILGQRGLMPSPKTGTVGENVGALVREFKGGKVEVRTDDTGVIHQAIGKVSFEEQKLLENFEAVKEAIRRAKPSAVKKDLVRSVTISTSMGPGIAVVK